MPATIDDRVTELEKANAELSRRLDARTDELKAAREREAAASAVLEAIARSPGDMRPVFEAIVESATRLCHAEFTAVARFEGGLLHLVALNNLSPEENAAFQSMFPRPALRDFAMGRSFLDAKPVQFADVLAEPGYDTRTREVLQSVIQYRSFLGVPILREGRPIGVIGCGRREVRPVAEGEIAILQTFADQAAIALENARLIGETREALAQQTATAEVLQVINASPGDLAPVFGAILEEAHALCGATLGTLFLFDGEEFRAAASHGYTQGPPGRPPVIKLAEDPRLAALVAGERLIHVHDLTKLEDPIARAVAARGEVRTNLLLPLRKERTLLGVLSCNRAEVRPFNDKEIGLLQNFAAQAVIAMENARLLGETREALAQQTATAEVLGVINSSPGDLVPVFAAMLDKATRLCGAHTGHLVRYENGALIRAASFGVPTEFDELLPLNAPMPDAMFRDSIPARMIAGRSIIHVPDLREDELYRLGVPAEVAAVQAGIRTALYVPLMKDEEVVGAFITHRLEVRPFSDKQIALLQNFAAQAVIAMENARLINETREALEQQTATAEVLQVINSSPGELAPVFDAMLEKAMRLCEASHGHVWRFDGEQLHAVAARGDSGFIEWLREHSPVRPIPGSAADRIARGEHLVHLADRRDEDAYQDDPVFRGLVDTSGVRASLSVALRRDETLLGMINVYRQEVRPFTDKQIALLQNFAAQAVIAMENARLITETREALEQQTATAEVLQVINSSPGDLAPVFDAMLDKALHLCQAEIGTLWIYDGQSMHAAAVRGAPPPYAQFLSQGPHPPSPIAHRHLLGGEPAVQIADITETEGYRSGDPLPRAVADLGGVRTLLAVPLRKDEVLLGVFSIYRQEVRPFAEKQIALLQNFAAQAVIAMENARLLGELRQRTRDLEESLEYQTATSDVLKVISRSTFDLQPVLDTLVQTAVRLCDAQMGHLAIRKDGAYRFVATHSVTPEWDAIARARLITPAPGTVAGRTLLERRVVHVADLAALATDPEYAWSEAITVGKIRTAVGVPLLREGEPIGVFILSRQRVEPFTERQIELVRTFADQAVIAIENTRLITETREALEQQTATAEILGVINASPGDLAPVFAAILDKAHTLCGATLGSLFLFDGELFRATATQGYPQDLAERLRQGVVLSATAQLLDNSIRWVQNPDLTLLDAPTARVVSGRGGVRTNLMLPLRKDGRLLGAISCNRREVRPFADKEIALLESFAAQAVIAMDNARLLDEIRQRQAELRVTFDNMGDGVAMFDAGLKLAAWNRNFQQMLDLPDEFVTARPSYAEYARYLAERGEFGPADVEAEVRRLAQVVGTHGSLERTRPDGRVVEVRYNPAPDGGFVLIYGDVTERKRAEVEIRAARDAAEKALGELKTAQSSLVHAEKMASLGQLTAGIAHEIKNPLNFVNNFAGLSVELLDELKEAAAPAVASLGDGMRAEIDELVTTLCGNLGKIAEHGRRADGIVTSMLAHSRGSSGERQRTDLNALVEDALNLAYHGARAQDQDFNITMERAFEPGLAPIEIVPQDLTRVFLNLFGNGFYAARKRARETGDGFRPVLGVKTRDLGDAVEVRVRDNGAGIPPELRERLFQPFFTTKPTGEGTGLGLSISYDIVTQGHGGAISVESEPGSFTEFTIRLPRRAAITANPAAAMEGARR